MIRLLIVDDSALMRKLLSGIFEQEGDFDIRTARNGLPGAKSAQHMIRPPRVQSSSSY